jgi:hypothetical protein
MENNSSFGLEILFCMVENAWLWNHNQSSLRQMTYGFGNQFLICRTGNYPSYVAIVLGKVKHCM